MKKNSFFDLFGNMEALISVVAHLGPEYLPPLAPMTHGGLQVLYAQCVQAAQQVVVLREQLNAAVNARKEAFDGIAKLATRVLDVLGMCGASEETLADLYYHKRKLSGKRATAPAPAEAVVTVADGESPALTTEATSQPISVAQLSFHARLHRFEDIYLFVKLHHEQYTPNDPNLTLDGLLATLTDLKAKYLAVVDAETRYRHALIERNTLLFQKHVGLVAIGRGVKKYIRGLYGGTGSAEYKQVKPLAFKMLVKDFKG